MAVANFELLLVTLYQEFVLSTTENALAILTLSPTQLGRLERIENDLTRIVLECTRDISCTAMRYLLDFLIMDSIIKTARVQSYLKIRENRAHPFFG